MADKTQIYHCEICGQVVSVLTKGAGTLVCCGVDMTLLVPNSTDASEEKHVPVVTRDGDTYTIEVGEVPHPMEPNHYIDFIVFECAGSSCVYKLDVDGPPSKTITMCTCEPTAVYAFCNIHGLFKASN